MKLRIVQKKVGSCPPAQDASHHQDYYIIRPQPKPSFATVTGRGDNPKYNIVFSLTSLNAFTGIFVDVFFLPF